MDQRRTKIEQVFTIEANGANTFYTYFCCRSDGAYMVINGSNNQIEVYSSDFQQLSNNFGNRILYRRVKTPSLMSELKGRCVAVYDSSDSTIKKFTWEEELVIVFRVGVPTHSLSTNYYGHMILCHQTNNHQRLVTIRDANEGHVLHRIEFTPDARASFGAPYYTIYIQLSYLYTLDQSACTLSLQTIDGATVKTVGKKGFLVGRLDEPTSLCTDIRNNAIISDCRNNRIVRFNILEDDTYCEILLERIHRPLRVAIDICDRLVVLTAKKLMIFTYDIKRPTAPTSVLKDLNQ